MICCFRPQLTGSCGIASGLRIVGGEACRSNQQGRGLSSGNHLHEIVYERGEASTRTEELVVAWRSTGMANLKRCKVSFNRRDLRGAGYPLDNGDENGSTWRRSRRRAAVKREPQQGVEVGWI